MKGAVKLTNEIYRAWLACENPKAAKIYRQAKRSAAQAVTEAKTWVWEELLTNMYSEGAVNSPL